MPQIFGDHVYWFAGEFLLALVMIVLPRQKAGTRHVAVICLSLAMAYALGIWILYSARGSWESYGHLIYGGIFGIAVSIAFGFFVLKWWCMYQGDLSK